MPEDLQTDDSQPEDTIATFEAHIEHSSGPVPPYWAMRGYEDVLSGSADRILTMAELWQRHRASYENRGLFFGFVVALALIALAAYVASLGFALASVGVVIGSIAGTAGTFVYSNRSRGQHLRERQAALQRPPRSPELSMSSKESLAD